MHVCWRCGCGYKGPCCQPGVRRGVNEDLRCALRLTAKPLCATTQHTGVQILLIQSNMHVCPPGLHPHPRRALRGAGEPHGGGAQGGHQRAAAAGGDHGVPGEVPGGGATVHASGWVAGGLVVCGSWGFGLALVAGLAMVAAAEGCARLLRMAAVAPVACAPASRRPGHLHPFAALAASGWGLSMPNPY